MSKNNITYTILVKEITKSFSPKILKLCLALFVALTLSQIVCVLQANAQSTSSGPPIFYVSKNGDNGGGNPTLAGTSWQHAWNELDQIDWRKVQAASDATLPNGVPFPGAIFNGSVTAVVRIDGGPKNSFMRYTTPLDPVITAPNPYKTYPVITGYFDDPTGQHSGQIVIDGSGFTGPNIGKPGINGQHQFGTYIWGAAHFQGPPSNPNGYPQPGIVVTNCTAGYFQDNLGYMWLSNVECIDNGIGILASTLQDLPNPVIGGQKFNVDPAPTGMCAGAGLHISNCLVLDSRDLNYHSNIWCARRFNNGVSFLPTEPFPYGYPSLETDCIICNLDPTLVGKVDGITYNNASNQIPGGNNWYMVRASILGPGLKNAIVNNQVGGDVFLNGVIFFAPEQANVVKSRGDDPNTVIYLANCISAIPQLNPDGTKGQVLNIAEGPNDKVDCVSISGGCIAVQGNNAIGDIVAQYNTECNTVVLGPNYDTKNELATDPTTLSINNSSLASWLSLNFSVPYQKVSPPHAGEGAASMPTPLPPHDIGEIPTPACGGTVMGLPVGTPFTNWGCAPGFTPQGYTGVGSVPPVSPLPPPPPPPPPAPVPKPVPPAPVPVPKSPPTPVPAPPPPAPVNPPPVAAPVPVPKSPPAPVPAPPPPPAPVPAPPPPAPVKPPPIAAPAPVPVSPPAPVPAPPPPAPVIPPPIVAPVPVPVSPPAPVPAPPPPAPVIPPPIVAPVPAPVASPPVVPSPIVPVPTSTPAPVAAPPVSVPTPPISIPVPAPVSRSPLPPSFGKFGKFGKKDPIISRPSRQGGGGAGASSSSQGQSSTPAPTTFGNPQFGSGGTGSSGTSSDGNGSTGLNTSSGDNQTNTLSIPSFSTMSPSSPASLSPSQDDIRSNPKSKLKKDITNQ